MKAERDIPVNFNTVRSRMRSVGLTEDLIARRLKINPNRVTDWFTGRRLPTLAQAERLAKLLRLPYPLLLLRDPPSFELPIPDLRFRRPRPSQVSLNLFEAVSDAVYKSAWYASVLDEEAAKGPSIPRALGRDVRSIANAVREALNVETLRKQARDHADFLKKLSDRAQDLGVIVMRGSTLGLNTKQKLDPEEFRGFSIDDPFAPVIFVNSRDHPAAQVFTFIHEFVHTVLREPGISDLPFLSPRPTEIPAPPDRERVCNEAAAEVLAPADQLRQLLVRQWDLETFHRVSRSLKVSVSVLIIRSGELGLLSRDKVRDLLALLREKRAERPTREAKVPLLARVSAWNSRLVTQTAIERVLTGKETYSSAAHLLRMSLSSFVRMLDKLEAR
ncbi:MAG TPA: XRE family transcriptional regulator [Bryobacteraceae bacterium]|nr:XRE family transcriptional regulator [Bryobacteraceae bacterium]